MQEPIVNRFVAAASEISSSDLYMTVKATMFTSPSANLNGVRCTEAFIDEIVKNQQKYVGLPLCADITKLENGLYKNLGHCYNSRTGTFGSTMIGSFYKFEKTALNEDETALIGYARVLKRNKKVCRAISELFAEGSLKFSFEITCGEYEKMSDGTIMIDASEKNYLEGMAIVSMPACPDAVALELVAEITGIGKEAEPMEKDKENAALEAEREEVTETAETYVTQTHMEHDRVTTYDTETGVDTETTVTVEQRVSGPVETAEEDEAANQIAAMTAEKQADENEPAAVDPEAVEETDGSEPEAEDTNPEADEAAEPEVDEEAEPEADEGAESTETAEKREEEENNPAVPADEKEEEDEGGKENASIAAFIAEMKEFVATVKAQNDALKREISEIKEHMTGKFVAEVTPEINPFMDNIQVASTEYRLLKDEPKQASYRLLN